MYKKFHIILLLTAHLLLLLLVGSLLAVCFYPILRRPDMQQFYLARVNVGLSLLLLTWVGTLFVQSLRQRRWVGAGALALLLVADGLALCGSFVLFASFGIASGPN